MLSKIIWTILLCVASLLSAYLAMQEHKKQRFVGVGFNIMMILVDIALILSLYI